MSSNPCLLWRRFLYKPIDIRFATKLFDNFINMAAKSHIYLLIFFGHFEVFEKENKC